jgi:predicted metalloprotease with PDZ domain
VVPGQYLADLPFSDWSFSVDLHPRKELASAAHVSWINDDHGILMFGDILPLSSDLAKLSGKIRLDLPAGWRQLEGQDSTILTDDLANEVAAIGKDVRLRTFRIGGTTINICIQGEWLFSDDEIANFARQIYGELVTDLFRIQASKEVFVNLFRFPQTITPGQWQAETRGRTVTIVSSDMPFKTQSLQRLHEQLRHEMFHLWLPNGVSFRGDYAWFYEGFALYSALKVGLATNQIRFEDFLDTLYRAKEIDSRHTKRMSLIEASKERFNGFETYMYARGMVIAFLFDLSMLDTSRTKLSVNDIVKNIYLKHKFPALPRDANETILAELRSNQRLEPLVNRYVLGSDVFDWKAIISIAGLQESGGLKVEPKLSSRQKDVLNALGYNNWRRLPSK